MRGKVVLTIVALWACTLLASCSSSGGGGGGGGGTKSDNGVSGKQVTFVPGAKGNPFYSSMACGAQAAANKFGLKLSVQGSEQFDATQQIPIVSAVIASHPSAVLIAPTDGKALEAPMLQMKQAGIKIVQVDTTVDDTSIVNASISSDNEQGGTLAADELAKLVNESGSVAVLSLKPGVSTNDLRVKGFTSHIAKHSGVKYLGVQYDNEQSAQAYSLTSALLSAHPDLKGIFPTDFVGAQGAAAAVEAAHLSGKVQIVTYDATPDVVSALKSGVVQAVVSQTPYQQGYNGVEQAVNALTGKAVTKTELLPNKVITADNVDSADLAQYVYKPNC